MNMAARYLTKSRFKLAMECPSKLFYTGKKEYANHNLEDPFLASLAEGGFQVGELAKAYFPGGHDIETLDIEEALQETYQLLKQDHCIIFEAAIKHHNLFIRVDVLIKEGNHIKLIEVKSSSADAYTEDLFINAKGELLTKWKPYVYDVAFQYYVAEQAFTEYTVTPYLMLVDKHATAPTDHLNQKFKIKKDKNGRSYVSITEPLTKEETTEKLLVTIDTKSLCRRIIDVETFPYLGKQRRFSDIVKQFANHYETDQLIEASISGSCKDCEFRANHREREDGLKSGFHECFKRNLQWVENDFKEDTIFNLRRLNKIDDFIAVNKIKFSELTAEDVGIKHGQTQIDVTKALTAAERRWLQLEKAQKNDSSIYINKTKLKEKMDKWTYPLHFIDFETAQPVIPFHKGEKPYETIAFQYSHHMVYEDGTIEHKSQYLNTEIGVNPNIDFVRNLKQSLNQDEGTIFRYSHHENTVLNKIYGQLELTDIEDKQELQQFIRHITQVGPKNNRTAGKRNMVDLCELVEKYYFDPYMKGSTSIKVVLPAILNRSTYLQEKYAKPIYGADDGIKSLNFSPQPWVKYQDGQVADPYQSLPKLFQDITDKEYKAIELHEEINNGGAAMTAYERLQFEDIPAHIRTEIENGMLKYCELDTLAMVFIYEAWVDIIYSDKQ